MLLYLPIALGLNLAALACDSRALYIAPLFAVVGLVSWGFLEYAIHRFVLHARRSFFGGRLSARSIHAEHHRNPRRLQQLHNPVARSLPTAAIYVLLAWITTGSWLDAAYLLGGFAAGYLYYEWLDMEAHHGAPRLQLFRYARKYHLQHHYRDSTVRYGITSPLFDLLFGTFRISRPASPHLQTWRRP